MGWFTELRALALLRRCARALEKSADAQMRLTELREREWEAANVRPKARPTEFGTLDLAAANKQYQDWLKAQGIED